MPYIDGLVIPVPVENRDAYLALAEATGPIFLEHGATRVVETWGETIPVGKANDFRTAVLAEEGEQVVFSWIEWPSKAVRDAALPKVMSDPRMARPNSPPFDGARLIFGGFVPILDIHGKTGAET